MAPLPQTVGRYRVLSLLGEGGTGTVVRATLGTQTVAIKLLRRTSDEAALARFEREARILATLGAAQGFVPLLEVGSVPWPYLVMPFLAGGTLRDRLKKGPLEVEEAVALALALARALGQAHALGIVHRDLKPENVLVDEQGRALVADLGLAKHFRRDVPGASRNASLSAHGEARGTFAYMAPEQVRDAASVGPPADVYSLGVILHECLAGRTPGGGEGVVAALARPSLARREGIRALRPEVPVWLESLLERTLAESPWERPQHGAEFARALEAGGRVQGERRTRVLAPVVGLVVALGVGLGALALRSTAGPASAPSPGVRSPSPPAGVVPSPASPMPAVAARGWFDEELRPGLSRGSEKPRYNWKLPHNAGDLELVRVPAGEFLMGSDAADAVPSERPRHRHPIARDYWIGRTPVTWRHYLAFCAAVDHALPARPEWARDDHPVVGVSFEDASVFAAWAGCALPHEAEWEKAARGTDGRTYPWGEVWHPRWLNFADRNAPPTLFPAKIPLRRDLAADDGFTFTAPVGSFPENVSPWGAVDMVGNVGQWCDEWFEARAYERYARGDLSPPGKSPLGRIYRGGSWASERTYCSTTARAMVPGEACSEMTGFRVVLR